MIGNGENIPEKITVLEATPDDADQIRHLIRDSWVKTMSETLEVATQQLEEIFQESMSDQGLIRRQRNLAEPPEGRSTFVAKAGTKVLGVCTVQRATKDSDNELVSFHVLSQRTGQGIGKSLWNTGEGRLDASKDTFLWTTPGTSAVEVYKRWGFEPVAYETEELKLKDPLSRPRVKMVKKAIALPE